MDAPTDQPPRNAEMDDRSALEGQPNWEAIDPEKAPHCPLCEYNLYGLTQARCPECGCRLSWRKLSATTAEHHPYLYEHHATNRRWAYCRTVRELWQGRQFWTELRPEHPVFVRRLATYWLTGFLLMLLAIVAGLSLQYGLERCILVDYSLIPASSVAEFLEQAGAVSAVAGALATSWALSMFLAFNIFRITLRRARVSPRQVWRCVVYSFDPIVPATLVPVLVSLSAAYTMGVAIVGIQTYRYSFWHGSVLGLLYFGTVYTVWHQRFMLACTHYLQLSHPAPTAYCATIIALCLIMAVWSNLTFFF